MSKKEEPDNSDPITDNSNPETAPEVPDFNSEPDSENEDSDSGVENSTTEADTPSEEQEETKPHGDSADAEETVPVDHQLAASSDETPSKPKRSRKRQLAYGGFIVVNIAILTVTLIVLRQPKTQSTATKVSTADPGNSQTDVNKPPEPPKTQHYVSEALKLEFDYPSDWRIESNPDSTFMAIQSAQFDAKMADGTTAKARGEIHIYAKYPETTHDVTSTMVISADSEKLTYKNPTKVQRTETLLSFVRDASVKKSDAVTASFISSDLNYKSGQLVGSKNYQKTNPFIIFKVSECDEHCAQAVGVLPIATDTLKGLSQFETAKAIITSMRFNE